MANWKVKLVKMRKKCEFYVEYLHNSKKSSNFAPKNNIINYKI